MPLYVNGLCGAVEPSLQASSINKGACSLLLHYWGRGGVQNLWQRNFPRSCSFFSVAMVGTGQRPAVAGRLLSVKWPTAGSALNTVGWPIKRRQSGHCLVGSKGARGGGGGQTPDNSLCT